MKNIKILYIGSLSGTCLDRANAYRRLGNQVTHIDPRRLLPSSRWVDRIIWRVGGSVLSSFVKSRLTDVIAGVQFDLIHIDNGELISRDILKSLRQFGSLIVNYCVDDPLGGRDGRRFSVYKNALSEYDLAVVLREQNVREASACGARRVLRVYFSADEINHAPRVIDDEIRRKWSAEVLFLGTWMPERGPFLAELIKRGVPLTIQGENWSKAPEWSILRKHWRGGAVYGDEYAYAIQCAKINIGLLSKGNRDLHTTRSLEIPALGGLLCAERTSEHLAMYEEGVEALFWDDAQECASVCQKLLANDEEQRLIAARGQERFARNRHGNQDVLQIILNAVFGGELESTAS